MPPPQFLLSTAPITAAAIDFASEEGAEAQFLGAVRGSEDGRPIAGIDYTAYLPMAEKMLHDVAARALAQHGQHRVFIQHRLGFVATRQPSILIRVWTKHSAQSFDLCRWYLQEIKTTVPIWKRIVTAE
jgi:molybdopterin synthase catalytic subunit